MMDKENKRESEKTVNEKELAILEFWNKEDIFAKSLKEVGEKKDHKNSYTFYDGPPFATGLPHPGHLLQSYLKDTIPRYQTMRGKYVRRVWGWDCHGLPVENLIEKELDLKTKKDIEDLGVENFTRACADIVLQYDKDWKQAVPRWGRWVDMENHYMTVNSTYTESCWWAFSELYKKGLAYEGYRVMHICPRCETPLAASEVAQGYVDLNDISVYAKFELVDEPNTYLLAWTTTPWTLPGNTAIAINKDITYVKVKYNNENYIVSQNLASKIFEKDFEIVDNFLGEKLVGKKYLPIFDYYKNSTEIKNFENIYKVWHAPFVNDSSGTGIAHEAPAFGEDDYNLAMKNNVPTIIHIGMDGRFKSEVIDFSGERVKWKGETQSTDKKICEFLKNKNQILKTEVITHSYPLCWRCDTPLLNYATSSWFVAVSTMREKLVEENKKVYWVPENVRDGRMGQWLEGARDWALSRSRYWGAPLPVWKSLTEEIFVPASLKELRERTKAKNKYFLVRHGETNANITKKIDTINSKSEPLNEIGVEQSKKAGEELKNKNIEIIISSPYLRTRQTAEIIADVIGIGKDKIVIDEKVKEWQVGEINEGKTWEEFYAENKDVNILHDRLSGTEETKYEISLRMAKTLYELEEKYRHEPLGKNILIVTHKSPIACLEIYNSGELFEKGTGNIPEFSNRNNAEILEIDFKPLPHDETGAVNFHLPHIDNLKVYDKEGNIMKREGGVFDCWFESGSMPYAQFHYPFENQDLFKDNFPADFIAEAQDQTRGWFYTMLVLGVGLFGKSPFKSVITSGLINAADGKKISKRLKNYTDPISLIETYGSDALRFYILSSPIVKGETLKFSDEGVKQVYGKNIARLLNVLSFYKMYRGGNDSNTLPHSDSKHVVDKFIISRLKQVKWEVTKGFDELFVDQAYRPIEKFIDDLSVWYLRRSRDRFKSEDPSILREVLATTKYLLQELAKILAPIMPFTAEMIWQDIKSNLDVESVHLANWGDVQELQTFDFENIQNTEVAREMITNIMEARIKAGVKVKQPLASATLFLKKLDDEYLQEIKDETNLKEIIFVAEKVGGEKVVLDLEITPELKKEGTLREIVRMLQDERKKAGLKVSDMVEVQFANEMSAFEKQVIEENLPTLQKVCGVKSISFGNEFKIFV